MVCTLVIVSTLHHSVVASDVVQSLSPSFDKKDLLHDYTDGDAHCFVLCGSARSLNGVEEVLRGSGYPNVCMVNNDVNDNQQRVRLAVFDMDSTLIQMETIDVLARFSGTEKQVAEVTERAMRGEIDFTESLKQRVATLKGADATAAYTEATVCALKAITPGAHTLIATLKSLGVTCVVVSGGFMPVCLAVKQALGLDHAFANELEVDANGKFTGNLLRGSPVVDGNFKASTLKSFAANMSLSPGQTITVGDGANDIPMMKAAGMAVAFRAKPLVRKSATHSIHDMDLSIVLYYLGVPKSLWQSKTTSHL